MKTLRALTLLALLSAPFPLVAQQSVGHARVGTLTRIATVDVLNESASPSVALAAPVVPAALGSGPYDPQATRWGDYSYATVDPNGEGIWLATEYIPALSRQTVDGLRNWGTRVLEVSTRGE